MGINIGGIFGGSNTISGVGSLLGSLGNLVGGGTGGTIGKVGQGVGLFDSFLSLFGGAAAGGPVGFLLGLANWAQQADNLFGGKKSEAQG